MDHHGVETIVEEVHGFESVRTVPHSMVTSVDIDSMNTVVYSQCPDGIIMEGDELVEPDISGAVCTDDSQELVDKVSPHQVMHMDLGDGDVTFCHQGNSENELIVGRMIEDYSLIVDGTDPDQPGYIAMKPHSMGEVVLDAKHVEQVVLEEIVGNEMIVEQSVEIGGDGDNSHGEIILVPNSMIKQEDIIEGGEVVVGSSVGNEIIIEDQLGSNRYMMSDGFGVSLDGSAFDDSRLIIDTENIKMEETPTVGYDCGECGAMMKSRAALKKHIKGYHSKRKMSKSKKSKNVDVDSSPSNQIYSCPSCSYTSQRRDKLDKHIQKHVLQEGYHPCGKRRHKPETPPLRYKHNAEEYKCSLCPYTCTVYKALRKHQKVHNSGNKYFTIKVSCKICGKDRPTDADLEKHMKKHRNDKHFLCDICNFASIQLKKIIQHRRMHTGEKPHLCPHCTYRSARRDNLRSHVRRMHKRENVYIDTFNPADEPTKE
ncbi:zinc finger protein 845-like [Limulus polyphemus]|uniref:Zinc finger protein 845-like n=1 Tax=Limulus polyphemus TaxID=6850 RepID=A0ABM1BSD0_LIMPO|nr:zinc finger protein 845-like [Limulus polyphemus]XP_013787727.1 zinc finger protein 845-like [Limulus polyphemus]